MTSSPKTGGEIDSWCTKCRLVLNHRIIAMVGTKPVRVECSTCGSHHNFRPRAPGEKAEKAEKPVSVFGGSAGKTAAAPRVPGMSPRAAAARREEDARLARGRSWEQAIMGKGVHDFKKYSVSETFSQGDLVRHTKFGDGVVTRIVDPNKIEILFQDEPRTLAQGLQ